MRQTIKRTLALLLAILIFCGTLPVTALATSDGSVPAAITESIAQDPVADPPQSSAPEESAPPSSSADTGGETVPPASSLPPEGNGDAGNSALPPDSSIPNSGASSQPPPDNSASQSESQSESTSQSASSSAASSSSTPNSTSDTAPPEETTSFVPLKITEMSTTFSGKPGDVVDFFVRLNRDDVQVQYQWQRLYTGKSYDGEGEAIHDYSEGEDTRYIFTLDGMTEEEVLAMNPDATWPGIEMYYDQLKKAGGDASQVQIEMNTPNYILNSEAAAAMNAGKPLPDSDGNAWKNIESATNSVYSHTVTEEDTDSFYRCRITIVDEAYIAAAAAQEQTATDVPPDTQTDTQAARMASLPVQDTDAPQAADTADSAGIPQDTSAAESEPAQSDTVTDEPAAQHTFLTDSMHVEMPAAEENEAPKHSVTPRAATTPPYLTLDNQWIQWVGADMEYITEDTYSSKAAAAANNPYWTKLSGGTRPEGTKYSAFPLIEGNKIYVLSAWYGKTIYVRKQGNSGIGTRVEIPAYTNKDYQTGKNILYKTAIRVLNAYIPDTGTSFYADYLDFIKDADGFLKDNKNNKLHETPNIRVTRVPLDKFNQVPQSYLTDAEGNYIYDLVIVGACTNAEPDISGAAAWALKDYIDKGYGFLIGHDTMYGYGGVTSETYVPDPNSTTTPYYYPDSKTNGHWNMNWLMGTNKSYTQASPYEAPSMILNNGDYTDKSTLYGDAFGESKLRVTKTMESNGIPYVTSRCPTNYPYAKRFDNVPFDIGNLAVGTATHTNQQMAYGTIWLDYDSNTISNIGCGRLVTDTRNGLNGTNNFYLATNGNFGMNQIGHIKDNINSAKIDEAYILANTIFYLSQRQQCQVCQSEQGGNKGVNFVRRISSLEQLEQLRDSGNWYNFPKNGCYMLTENLRLPEDWQPITGFSGHFNADSKSITAPEGVTLFAPSGELGTAAEKQWNLGTDQTKGINSVAATDGTRRTGVARVVGYLHELFGTDNGNAYAGYRVEVVGTDGVTYSCIANADGKYVLSNLPCTGIMTAHVYSVTGAEVTNYGPIRTNVSAAFWQSCETTPLYLLGFTAQPVRNVTVYEDLDAVLVDGGINSASLVTDIVWQYSTDQGQTWNNLAGSALQYQVMPPVFHEAGDASWTETKLTVKKCLLSYSGYNFRAVFNQNGKTVNTYETGKEGFFGLLTVKERPAYVTQAFDQTVWAGNTATFTSTMDFWKAPADGLNVKWQYRESADATWKDVSASKFKDHTVQTDTKTATRDPALAPYLTTSTLKINKVDRFWSQYSFRVVYTYAERTWASSDYDATGRTGLLIVKQPEIKMTNPTEQTVNIALGQSVSNETATFQSVITYKPGELPPTIVWQYNTLDSFTPRVWNQAVATSLYPSSGIQVNITNSAPVAVAGEENTFNVTSTMTIKNAPVQMDYTDTKYRFQCTAVNTMNVQAATPFAPLNIVYPIDIKHNASTSVRNGDGSYTYTYPELAVIAPPSVKLCTLILQFSSANVHSGDAISYSNVPAGTSVSGDQYAYTFHNNAGLTAEQWQTWMRANTSWRVFDPSVQAYWYIDERATSGSVYFNSDNGHYYELMSLSESTRMEHARDLAHARSYLGLTGYLCNITSASEQEAVRRLTQGQYGFLGGSPWPGITGKNEHEWVWIDGPEAGISFYWQDGLGEFQFGGHPMNEMYNAWFGREPYNGFGDAGKTEKGLNYSADSLWKSQGYSSSIWVVEYGGYPGQSIQRSSQSAWDIDTIGAQGVIQPVNASLTAESVIYDGAQHGAAFTISGNGLSQADINAIRAAAMVQYYYPNGTWSTTAPKNAGDYQAKLTFQEYIFNTYLPPRETLCNFSIQPRGLIVQSTGNTKVYDGNTDGTVKNLSFAAFNATNQTGVVAGDTVMPSVSQFTARYADKHQTNGKEIPMTRTGELGLANDPNGDYYVLGEQYFGPITSRGIAVRSLYLDEPDTPRNIKRYDGTTKATVSKILLDNVVAGDAVTTNAASYKGTYATAESGETLKVDGTVQDDRDKKYTENPITLTETVSLINNEYGDYHIASEQYSGAISREILGVRVDGMQFTYGREMTYPPRYAQVYSNTSSGVSTNLVISKLVPRDTLTIDPAKTQFVYTPVTNTTPVGMYPLEITGITEENYPVLKNYILWRQPGYIEVVPCKVRITVNDYEKKYGDTNPAFGVKYEYHMPGAYNLDGSEMYRTGLGPSGDTPEMAFEGTLKFNTTCNWQSDVQWADDNRTCLPYPVYGTGLVPKTNVNGKYNYEIEWVSGGITVYPVEVTVTGASCVKTYGNADPALTYTLSRPRVKAGDLPFAEARRMAGEDVGNYRLIFSHMYDPNYIVKEGPPVYLEIRPAILFVNVMNAQKMYGEENPHFEVYYSGFKMGDNEESAIDGHAVASTSATIKSHVGSYGLSAVGASVKKNKNGLYNYDLIDIVSYLTITKRPVDIYAESYTKLIGAPDPALTFHLGEGQYVVDEMLPLKMRLTRVEGEALGQYDIYADPEEIRLEHGVDCACQRRWDNFNYEITYHPGKLTIKEPDKLVATVTPAEKYYGEANPGADAYTLKYYLNGRWIYDPSTLGLTGTPTLTTLANPKSPVGEYPVALTGISSTLYDDFEIKPTTLTIKPRPMTVIGNKGSKKYGETDPPLTYKLKDGITGVEYADGTDPAARVNPGDLAGNIDRAPGNDVTVYNTNLGTLPDDVNYALTHEPGWFEIETAWAYLNIPEVYTKYQGDPNPKFEAEFLYLTNGDTPEMMSENLIFETDCTTDSPVGEYIVMPNFSKEGAKEKNYAWNFMSTIIKVVERPKT